MAILVPRDWHLVAISGYILFVAAATWPTNSPATFSAGFHSPLTVVGEISGTVLTAYVTSTGCLFSVLGEVSRISRVLYFSHLGSSFKFAESSVSLDPIFVERATPGRVVFNSGVISLTNSGEVVRVG